MTMSYLLRCLTVSALAAVALPGAASAQADKPWIIGEVAPLTGPAATVGTRLNKAAKMWADEVNAAGGIKGRKVEITTCNDENRPEKAVACTRDMIDKGAVIILGNTLTASLRAMQPLFRDGPILLIPSPNVVPPADSYAFQVSPSDEGITQAVANYLNEPEHGDRDDVWAPIRDPRPETIALGRRDWILTSLASQTVSEVPGIGDRPWSIRPCTGQRWGSTPGFFGVTGLTGRVKYPSGWVLSTVDGGANLQSGK